MTEIHEEYTPEKQKERLGFDLIVARHAEYFDPAFESSMYTEIEKLTGPEREVKEEEVRSKLGHLTGRGVEQARSLGLDTLNEALATRDPVDITFIPSAQEYESPRFPDAPWAGRRAEETAIEATRAMMETVQQLVDVGEIDPDQVRILTPVPEQPFQEGDKPNQRLIERDVYYSPLSPGLSLVDAYRERAAEIANVEEATGSRLTAGYDTPSFVEVKGPAILSNKEKELWARGAEDLDTFGREINNETSTEVAKRAVGVMSDMAELADLHRQRHPDRRLVVGLISHDAVVAALSHKGFGTENPVIPSYTDRINFRVSTDGVASLNYNGTVYPKNIAHEK